ncbi:50S ribosomal protein L32 [Prescottella equi]
MAVPKRRMSRSNTRSRRSQWKTTAPTLITCPNRACGERRCPTLRARRAAPTRAVRLPQRSSLLSRAVTSKKAIQLTPAARKITDLSSPPLACL